MISKAVTTFALLGCVYGPVFADQAIDEAIQALNKMKEAAQQLNYHGTFVYLHDKQMETMQLVHQMDGKGERERLVHLNGPAREIIRKDDVVTCYMPDKLSVMVERRATSQVGFPQLPENPVSMLSHYRLSVSDSDERVASRAARRIEITPNDNLRFGYRVWTDKESGLMLKSHIVDENGEVVESILFTQLDVVKKVPKKMLAPSDDGKKYTWYRNDGSVSEVKTLANSEQGWRVGQIPAGFRVDSYQRQYLPTTGEHVDHLLLSDGLASVSVYVGKLAADDEHFLGDNRLGGMNMYGAVVDAYQITALGEVPPATLALIANSVVANQAARTGSGATSGD